MALKWYLARNKQKHGPYSLDQLQGFAASWHILPTDMLLQEGAQKWVVASSLEDLFTTTAKTVQPAIAPVSRPEVSPSLLARPVTRDALFAPGGVAKRQPLEPGGEPRPLNSGKKGSARLQETVLSGSQVGVDTDPARSSKAGQGIPNLPLQIGDYLLTRVLAQGGMSLTFLGHVVNNPTVRIVIKLPLQDDPETIQRFRDEIAILSKLDHPGVVHVLGSGVVKIDLDSESRTRPWFAMEYIEGESLRHRLQAAKRLPWREVRQMIGDIVDALSYLAERHICHRDIKPDNLIFDTIKNRWILVDFGIARSLMNNPRLTLTLAGHDPGSWDYMSPEQLDGTAEVDHRTDIYSLGKTAWEALVGMVPRVGTPLPCAMLGDRVVPREVDALISTMVAHDPKDRYKTPARLTEALEVGALRIARRKKRKKFVKRLTRVAGGILVLAVVVGLIWYGGDSLATREATDLYLKNKESPTRASIRLKQFLASHRFWGQSYATARLAELKPLAEDERQRMLAEYETTLHDVRDASRDDNFRLARASNFIKKYEGIFDDAEEMRDMAIRVKELEQIVLEKKEQAEAADLIARTKELEAKGEIKRALDLCKETIARLQTEGGRQIVEKRRAEITDRFITTRLKEIDSWAGEPGEEGLIRAQDGIKDLQATVGSTPETSARLKRYDKSLWDHYSTQANEQLAAKRYNQACARLQFYLDNSRVKYHSTEVAPFRERITAAEDDGDWATIESSAAKNIEQKTFSLAIKDVRGYQNRWPSGRHTQEAIRLRNRVIFAHYQHLRKMTDLKEFNEEFREFGKVYSDVDKMINSLQQTLCFLAHGAIFKSVTEKGLNVAERRDRLREIDFSHCDEEKAAYLKALLKRASDYLDNQDNPNRWHWLWRFVHYYRQAPRDAVVFNKPRSVYFIRITSIEVELSRAYYDQLKGVGDADPRVDLSYGRGQGEDWMEVASLFKILGPINTRSFTLTQTGKGNKIGFYLNVDAYDSFGLDIADADTSFRAPTKGTIFLSRKLKSSGTLKDTWPDGTSVTITYTSE